MGLKTFTITHFTIQDVHAVKYNTKTGEIQRWCICEEYDKERKEIRGKILGFIVKVNVKSLGEYYGQCWIALIYFRAANRDCKRVRFFTTRKEAVRWLKGQNK